MGWLRCIGSLKLQVSFTKETYKTDDILQKRPVILWSLLIVATANRLVESYGSLICVTWRLFCRNCLQIDVCKYSYVNEMSWLSRLSIKLIFLKLQVSFTKETYKTDDILQKRPLIQWILSYEMTVKTSHMNICKRLSFIWQTCHSQLRNVNGTVHT